MTTDDYKNKKNKLLLGEQKKLKYKLVKKRLMQITATLAIIFIIAVNHNTIVQGWWHKFLNIILDMQETHTEISFQEHIENNATFNGDGVDFHFIPDNFTLNNLYNAKDITFISFDNNHQEYFQFTIRTVDDNLSVDTEDAEVSNIKFKGKEALFSSNQNVNILVWYDDTYSYNLAGNIPKDTLVKIGENIEIENI